MKLLQLDQHKLKDKVLHCCDCGDNFVFTVGEQLFFVSKSLSEPKRCPQCRELRKRTLIPDPEVQHG